MKNISDESCRENQNTYFMFVQKLFFTNRAVYNMEKYCTAGQATDDNVAHAHCMLDPYVYRHKLTSPLQ